MARAFVLNEPYPSAPFSTLYLFGRGQDIGFFFYSFLSPPTIPETSASPSSSSSRKASSSSPAGISALWRMPFRSVSIALRNAQHPRTCKEPSFNFDLLGAEDRVTPYPALPGSLLMAPTGFRFILGGPVPGQGLFSSGYGHMALKASSMAGSNSKSLFLTVHQST